MDFDSDGSPLNLDARANPFQPRAVQRSVSLPFALSPRSSSTPETLHRLIASEDIPQVDPSRVPLQGNGNGVLSPAPPYDPFVTPQSSIAGGSAVAPHPVPNPYSHDAAVAASMGGGFFAGQSGFQQPVQYHLYAPIGPHSTNITGYQRNVHDLFLPNDFREELQKKAAATLQTLPSKVIPGPIKAVTNRVCSDSSLPAHVDHFHSLVPLDLTHQKNAAMFGFPSWVYKAQSNKDGNFYVLRRLEGYRLTNEKAIRSVQAWKRITNGSVVTVHDAFTTRVFQDSSLIFVMDYHPLSKTLAEQHLGAGNRFTARSNGHIPEQVMWSYVTQIASALKAIHSSGLAARIIDASKILLTGKNRIRLNACAIMDVVQHDTQRSVQDLQLQDLVSFGQLMLNLGVSAAGALGSPSKAMEHFTRAYSPQLKNSVFWLLNGLQKDQERSIDIFISGISSQLISTFDSALQMDDQLTSDLSRELENGRLVRLITKLNFINERPEYEHDRQWSENGERYFLKLFRDYVFHQVDAQNNAVVDLGHVLTCLNKLDAGTEEKVTLISRDEQSCFVVSYKELKKALESSFQALLKPVRRLH
ncbi:hypothetical protein EIK77_008482 [Talaromyces pinophilus]|nr:hypothetical protein EIK77_008482 [Talaromyces pinophilus]